MLIDLFPSSPILDIVKHKFDQSDGYEILSPYGFNIWLPNYIWYTI